MMRLEQSACAAAFALPLLTGCTLDPHYERPVAPIPAAYPQGDAYGTTRAARAATDASASAASAANASAITATIITATATNSGAATASPTGASTATASPLATATGTAWRSFFRDERLQKLIDIALANNRDLRVAALNVAEYEAQYRITRAALAPSITASGSMTRERTQGAIASSSDVSIGTTSWEIDFFGRLRSLKRQALENYLATDASRQSTQISLIATVATDYLTLLSDERLLQLTEDT